MRLRSSLRVRSAAQLANGRGWHRTRFNRWSKGAPLHKTPGMSTMWMLRESSTVIALTYEEARAKLNRLQYTSDITSGPDENTRKRKRCPPQRYLTESSEEDVADKSTKRRRTRPLLSESSDDSLSVPDPPPIPETFPQAISTRSRPDASTSADGHQFVGFSSQAEVEAYEDQNPSLPFDDTSQQQLQLSRMSNPGSLTPSAVPSPLTETQQPREVSRQRRQLRQQSSGDEFQKQVLRTLYMVRVAQQQHGDMLQELCSRKTHSEDYARPPPGTHCFPVRNISPA
ncbi:uncharacterized protein LOC135383679 [Ornithodoros turicata]|uniref:uncharacterized protein LOC135383679 n=1 Tax=Ornithodoros turicata TaxID=34597 RepID=UPI00313A34BD